MPADPLCKPDAATLAADAPHYLIVDTNVVLHQPDFLEHASVTDVVILSTVYQEVQARNTSVFLRLRELLRRDGKRFYFFSNEHHKVRGRSVVPRSLACVRASLTCPRSFLSLTVALLKAAGEELCAGVADHDFDLGLQDTYVAQGPGESVNDRNDRAIRTATQWYTSRAAGKPVLMLSEDAGNLAKAREAGLQAMPLSEYVEAHAVDKSVVDVVAWYGAATCCTSAGHGSHHAQPALVGISCHFGCGHGHEDRPHQAAVIYAWYSPAACDHTACLRSGASSRCKRVCQTPFAGLFHPGVPKRMRHRGGGSGLEFSGSTWHFLRCRRESSRGVFCRARCVSTDTTLSRAGCHTPRQVRYDAPVPG
jgi:PIN domain